MKSWLLILALISHVPMYAQVDTAWLKSLYDRCLDFSEDKRDSLLHYAGLIERESHRLNFDKGDVLSLRLKGIYEELESDYESAINYYLQSLEAARKLRSLEYETAALSDLAILYANIKEPEKAKEFYLQVLKIEEKKGDLHSLVNTYNNLSVIYSRLNKLDSARLLLNKALKLGKPHEKVIDLSSTYNNIGNIYFKEKKYREALSYFKQNYAKHTTESNLGDLWFDILNMADVFIEKRQFDSAAYFAQRSLTLAQQLESKSKEADSYSLLAKLAEYKGEFRAAYEFQQQWYRLDTAIVNGGTHQTIAELQERFNAKEREAANQLLKEQIEKEAIRVRAITLLAIALAIIGVLIAIAFITKRRANRRLQATNELVVQQNEKLAELNHEKNALISIVSHDLNTPFATIQVWGSILQSGANRLNGEQQKALNKIIQVSTYGERLINRILDVEKKDIGHHKIHLEHFDMNAFMEEIIESFRPMAARKNISLHAVLPGKKLILLSDRHLVSRICENLLSNAIKYTPREKNVWIHLSEENDTICIKIRDEGVGIDSEELPFLFSKYSKISSQPTDGETSTGLGLSIVKRIVEEINGKIFCESGKGEGSVFTVLLKK